MDGRSAVTEPLARVREEWSRASATESFDADRAALATADSAGRPSVRFILVREMTSDGFVFFTNYESRKAQEIESNPHGALAWHWASTGVQVRAEGRVVRASDERSDAYFAGRPRESQLAACASPQSAPVTSRAELEKRVERVRNEHRDGPVPRPSFWGGYLLIPNRVELWYSHEHRLHDRFLYRFAEGRWNEQRLAP